MDGSVAILIRPGAAFEGDRGGVSVSDFGFCLDVCASADGRKLRARLASLASLEGGSRFRALLRLASNLPGDSEHAAPQPGSASRPSWLDNDVSHRALYPLV